MGEALFRRMGVEDISDDYITTDLLVPGSVDLIVTSPPYNVEVRYGASRDNLSY